MLEETEKKSNPKHHQHAKFIGAVIGLIVLLGGAATLIWFLWPRPIFSAALKKQVSFVILEPGSGTVIDRKSINYNSSNGVLTFDAKLASNNSVVITEQASPSEFSDIPEVYNRITEKLNTYSSFDSVYGKVYLTKPTQLKGGQSAVMDGQGTLTFMHPQNGLSDDDWRRLFNGLNLIK